ncbi:hypothetical protein BCD48_38285 [Pseudofrankia sp. BMG5.36]|nr:hypothetical protein BCD48_38285 [Pseudofrankia sp. BMG5.36]
MVVSLPDGVADRDVLRLANALTFLSKAAWRTYTHPASGSADLEVNGEGWRRDMARQAFAKVLAAIENPYLHGSAQTLHFYRVVEEAAHRAGRALHAVGSGELTRRVVDDVRAELDAVEQAERGDLRGRGRQAVVLTRADASPLQVAAADAALRDNVFGDGRLFTEVEPTAAAIAAARWLYAAATVTAEVWGGDPDQVLVESDNIEALPHETPTFVLERLVDGESPQDVVLGLVAEARDIADGVIPNLTRLLEQIDEANSRTDILFEVDGENVHAHVIPHRLTPLDPLRPARDLLEDLLRGVRGCYLLFDEYAYSAVVAERAGTDRDDDRPIDDDDVDDEQHHEIHQKVFAEFVRRVREAAGEYPGISF